MGVISQIMRNGFTAETLLSICAVCFVVFCILPIHEYAHALVAYKLGDNTAKRQGRLTLNPLAHIDPLGALMILLVGFGFAKPVPVNMFNFKPRKRKLYMAIVSFAGPLSNLILSVPSLVFCCAALVIAFNSTNEIFHYIASFFRYVALVNVSLAVFNLIPIPPLDGSRILNAVLPDKYYYKIMQYERYIMLALFALIFLDVIDISGISSLVYNAILRIVAIPFGISDYLYLLLM